MKKSQEKIDWDFLERKDGVNFITSLSVRKKLVVSILLILVLSIAILPLFSNKELIAVSLGDDLGVQIATAPIATTAVKRSIISIPAGTVKSNPFLPYRNLNDDQTLVDISDFDLVEPPEVINENSDAARVMDTIVSGILFDRHSPSAILNIEGNDYLVKKGDVVNNYKVLSILEDSVTVKLGENVYQAGIGEILTEGTLNHNNISNLNNKFGGVR